MLSYPSKKLMFEKRYFQPTQSQQVPKDKAGFGENLILKGRDQGTHNSLSLSL